MKRSLLTFVLPVFLTIACSQGVWAYEPGVTPPPCHHVLKDASCELCEKVVKAEQGCSKCGKPQAAEGKPCAGGQSGNCEHMRNAEGKPCGGNRALMQDAEGKPCGENCGKTQQMENKPCCDKAKPR